MGISTNTFNPSGTRIRTDKPTRQVLLTSRIGYEYEYLTEQQSSGRSGVHASAERDNLSRAIAMLLQDELVTDQRPLRHIAYICPGTQQLILPSDLVHAHDCIAQIVNAGCVARN